MPPVTKDKKIVLKAGLVPAKAPIRVVEINRKQIGEMDKK